MPLGKIRLVCNWVTVIFGTAVFFVVTSARAQANLAIYTDTLVNSFQDWSYSISDNIANTSPVYTNSVYTNAFSISVTITSSGGALALHSPTFNTSPYTNVSFWINGGPTGGQRLQIRGMLNWVAQTPYVLPKLGTNTWQQFTVPLSTLGVANQSTFNGIWIQDASGGAQPVFYVADIQVGAAPAPALVHLNVNAAQALRTADPRWFGVNLATWDGYLGNAATVPLMQQAGILTVRLPGGSGSDVYHWANNASQNATFYQVATNPMVNGRAYITVNYGSGTSNEAAAWVSSANITNHCHIKYWEIGNECYGTWETDNNTYPWDPYTYAVRAAGYMAAMRAVDPTIKIGVVATPGDDNNSNGYTNHPAYNSRTSQSHNGWVPVMLATLKSLGAQPDFLIHHVYPQYTGSPSPPNPSSDSDPLILQNNNWAGDAATLRQEISDYWGTGGTNIELCCTENNSDSSNGGKQLSSLVNGLYIADTLGRLMQTEFNSYLWWDLRNGTGNNGDIDVSLYGWRIYGDEGIITGLNGLNPTYYGLKMIQYFARPGDTILNATSDYLLLSVYAAQQSNGTLKVLVINKDPAASFTGQINLNNYLPDPNVIVRTYGESQDNATEFGLSAALQDVATTSLGSVSNPFTYSFPPYSMTVLTFAPSEQLNLHSSGANLSLKWQQGTLLTATNVTGPWVTNLTVSPYTVFPTNAQMFYKVRLQANPISLNFSGSGTEMGSSESAGVVPETNWNNAANSSGIGLVLNDFAGNSSGATVTWSANGVFNTGVSDNVGNNRMMRNYLDTGNTTTTTVTVVGLPANTSGWNVYVYFDGSNTETREGSYTISGTGTTTQSINGIDTANTDFSGTFIPANGTAGNYVLFTIPNVSGFTLSATPVANGASAPRAPVNGIQIVPR